MDDTMSAPSDSRRSSLVSFASSLSLFPYSPVVEVAEKVVLTVQRPLYSPCPVVGQAQAVRMSPAAEKPVLLDLVIPPGRRHRRRERLLSTATERRISSGGQSSTSSSSISISTSPPSSFYTLESSSQRSRSSSTASERSCEAMSESQTRKLWRCMLDLQGRYGCYNSRRIDLAMEADEFDAMMPSKFIIDILNDSVHELPAEGWDMLQSHFSAVEMDDEGFKSQRRRFWGAKSVKA